MGRLYLMKRKVVSLILAVFIVVSSFAGFGTKLESVNAGSLPMDSYPVTIYVYDEFGYKTFKSMYFAHQKYAPVTLEGDVETMTINVDAIITDQKLNVTSFIFNDKTYNYPDTKSLKLYDKDFKVDKKGKKSTEITLITSDQKNRWLDGRWFDGNAKCTYNATGSWKSDSTGWWFEDTTGWYAKSQWQLIDGNWFYFGEDGYAKENGWHKCGSDWYYIWTVLGGESVSTSYDDKGNVTSTETHINYWGGYVANAWVDGYWINEDGTCTYPYMGNWKSDSNGWWFEDESGWYPTSALYKIDGNEYYFKDNGYIAVNETIEVAEGKTYHFDANGVGKLQ